MRRVNRVEDRLIDTSVVIQDPVSALDSRVTSYLVLAVRSLERLQNGIWVP
jgi:wobble nucleotide-excising tRNase